MKNYAIMSIPLVLLSYSLMLDPMAFEYLNDRGSKLNASYFELFWDYPPLAMIVILSIVGFILLVFSLKFDTRKMVRICMIVAACLNVFSCIYWKAFYSYAAVIAVVDGFVVKMTYQKE